MDDHLVSGALDNPAALHIVLNIVILDDYTNIAQAVTYHLLPDDATPVLREANGLLNRLIHVYNSIDNTLASKSIERLLPQLDKCLEVIERWVHQTQSK